MCGVKGISHRRLNSLSLLGLKSNFVYRLGTDKAGSALEESGTACKKEAAAACSAYSQHFAAHTKGALPENHLTKRSAGFALAKVFKGVSFLNLRQFRK